jgi:hypothetical protein
MNKFDYTIGTDDKDFTVVTVHYPNRESSIRFEGKNHSQKAMEFVAQFLMVQMGQIGI